MDDHQRRSTRSRVLPGQGTAQFRAVAAPNPHEGLRASLRAAFDGSSRGIPADWERLLLELR